MATTTQIRETIQKDRPHSETIKKIQPSSIFYYLHTHELATNLLVHTRATLRCT